jgi:hypothetical protein
MNFKIEKSNDLKFIAQHMVDAVNKHNWDLKDLIHYFESANGFDYKVRVNIYEEMNMYEAKKTYKNVFELLQRIVAAN